MALRIIIDGPAGSGKSAVGTLIEELLVDHGFMVSANLDSPRKKDEASRVARVISATDPRVVLIEVQATKLDVSGG